MVWSLVLYSGCVSFIAMICLVDSSYSGVQDLAWYRFSNYLAMCSYFVYSGSVSSFPSSAIVLYSSSLLLLACLLACHMQFGSIFVLLMSSLILFSVCSASNFLFYPLFISMHFLSVFSQAL